MVVRQRCRFGCGLVSAQSSVKVTSGVAQTCLTVTPHLPAIAVTPSPPDGMRQRRKPMSWGNSRRGLPTIAGVCSAILISRSVRGVQRLWVQAKTEGPRCRLDEQCWVVFAAQARFQDVEQAALVL